jgi:hypothetical protein
MDFPTNYISFVVQIELNVTVSAQFTIRGCKFVSRFWRLVSVVRVSVRRLRKRETEAEVESHAVRRK